MPSPSTVCHTFRCDHNTEPKDEPTSDSNPNWINLAWELPNKGKKRALSKALKSKKDFESV